MWEGETGVCVFSLHVFCGVHNPFPCHPIGAGGAMGGGDSSVVSVLDSSLKGWGSESLQEQQENFLQGQLAVLTLILVSVPPPCYRSST